MAGNIFGQMKLLNNLRFGIKGNDVGVSVQMNKMNWIDIHFFLYIKYIEGNEELR